MPVSSVTEHWIKPDAVTINLNHFGDPDYLQVSVLAGAVIMAFKQDVIAYNAAHNYRTWPLQAANTYLETTSAYNVYARLTRSEVNALALIVYDPVFRDIEGRSILFSEDGTEILGEADPVYFYVFLGQISGSIGSFGQSTSREWTVDFRFGNLDTSQYRNEEAGGEWQKMFRLNKVTNMIDVLKTFSSAVFKRLFIGDKEIQDIKRSTDSDESVPVSDSTIPTTKYVREANDDRYLRKDKDDRTPYNLGVGKTLTIGGDVVSEHFANETIKGGYAIRKNEDGEYDMESDNIIARILAKTYDLFVQNHATFVGNLSSEEFISGFLGGKGWSIRMKEWLNAAGVMEKKSVAEFDDLIIRGSMRVFEFIVSQLLGENDNRVFTGMMEVDHYDAADGKIYLKTDGGKLYNPFRVDDVIIVQQYGQPTEDNGYYVTKQYELIVTEAKVGNLSDGEDRLDWITFSNFTTPIEGGSESLIAERDTLVRIDNLTNNDRKGIIQMMAAGKDTPYMDFIYGKKTDPENSLKGRLGNLGGVWNELFGKGGWLRGFGAYLTNLYAVGEFVIAHTGENVSDTIEIAKGQFRTNFRQTTYDLSEEDNFFTNAALTNNCEHWILGSEDGTEYFMVDGLPQFFNFDVYATEDSYAGLVEWKGRDMLRLNKSAVRQLNPLIRKAGTHKVYKDSVMNEDGTFTDSYDEVPDTLYLSVRLYVAGTGNVEIGFIGEDGAFIDNDFHVAREMVADEDAYNIKLAGTWDGVGDFCITSTGDVYVDMLSLTDKPLENFKITTETKVEQDATRISLLGKEVNQTAGTVTDLTLVVDAQNEQISSLVTKTNAIDNTISSSGWINEADSVRIFSEQLDAQGVATKAEIKVLVQDEVSKIEISADQIYLNGYAVINDHFTVDTYGNVTMHDFTANNASIYGELNVSKDNLNIYVGPNGYNNTPSIEFNKEGIVYAYMGIADSSGIFTGGTIFLHDTSGNDLNILSDKILMFGGAYNTSIQPGQISLSSLNGKEWVYLDDKGLTLHEGASISNFSIRTFGTMTSNYMYDFNKVGESITIQSPSLHKGRVIFVKGTSDSAELVCSGKIIARDQSGTTDSVKIYKGARIFVSDGVYWYEFHCA